MKHDELKQQIPDDLSLLYGIVQTHFGEGLAPVTNNGVKALIERIAELEAKLPETRKPKCPDCNSVGMSHCSDPENCGGVYWPDEMYRKLEAKLAQARKEALEEALASCADQLRYFSIDTCQRFAGAIRALIAKEPA